jgi:hypothetical protein
MPILIRYQIAMASHPLDLEQRRDEALLEALLAECRLRRARLLEELGKAKAAGDLAAYQRLVREWRRHPRVFGAGPPPV